MMKVGSVYKGFTVSFYTIPTITAIVMSANEFAKRAMHVVPGHESLFESVAAGTFAGVVNSFVVGPVELVKCKM